MADVPTSPAAAFFGNMGAVLAVCLCCLGSAFGTAKAGTIVNKTTYVTTTGIGISHTGIMKPELGKYQTKSIVFFT